MSVLPTVLGYYKNKFTSKLWIHQTRIPIFFLFHQLKRWEGTCLSKKMLRKRTYPKTSPIHKTSLPRTAHPLPHRIQSLDVSCGDRHLTPSYHSKLEEKLSFPFYKGSLLTHRHGLSDNSQMGTTLITIQNSQVQIYVFSTAGWPLTAMVLVVGKTLSPPFPVQVFYREFCQKQSTAVVTLLDNASPRSIDSFQWKNQLLAPTFTQQSL